MASPLDFASALDSRKQRLHTVVSELEGNKTSLSKLGWKDFDGPLKEIEKNLRKIVDEYNALEKAFEARVKQTKAEIDKKEKEVAAREQASLARVQEQKDAAVASILEEKRKWAEEKKRLETGIGSIKEVVDVKKEQPTKKSEVKVDAKKGEASTVGSDMPKNNEKSAVSESEAIPRPELKALCESMNAQGLRKLIAKHRQDLNMLSAELPPALKCAQNPAQLVLKALDGYYPNTQNPRKAAKDNVQLQADRRACVILLEALAEVLADPILGIEHPVVPANLRKPAKQLADLWKSKMTSEGDSAFGLSLHAQSFLQLVATFGLASAYNQDELCKLIGTIARRKQTPTLCRALGLSEKVSDMVRDLIKDGKQIDALVLASAFGLLENFKPVPLLKSYLNKAKKVAQATIKSGNNSPAAQNEANQKELAALNAVLKAIGEYKIESEYPTASIEQRIARLEKARADRKKSVTDHVEKESGKLEGAKSDRKRSPSAINAPQSKKFRSDDNVHRNSGGIAGTEADKQFFGTSGEAQYGGVGASSYGTVPQVAFDRGLVGGYGSAYTGANRNPGLLSSSYMYPPDGLGTLGYGASFVNPSSYGGYNYESSLAITPSGYRPYLR